VNSIRRPRRRPRRDSVSYRTFAWVLIREAFLTAVLPPDEHPRVQHEWRAYLVTCSTQRLVTRMRRYLERHPLAGDRP